MHIVIVTYNAQRQKKSTVDSYFVLLLMTNILYKGSNPPELISIEQDEQNNIYKLSFYFSSEYYMNDFIKSIKGCSLIIKEIGYVVKFNRGTYEVDISNLQLNDNTLAGRMSFIYNNILIQINRTASTVQTIIHQINRK